MIKVSLFQVEFYSSFSVGFFLVPSWSSEGLRSGKCALVALVPLSGGLELGWGASVYWWADRSSQQGSGPQSLPAPTWSLTYPKFQSSEPGFFSLWYCGQRRVGGPRAEPVQAVEFLSPDGICQLPRVFTAGDVRASPETPLKVDVQTGGHHRTA